MHDRLQCDRHFPASLGNPLFSGLGRTPSVIGSVPEIPIVVQLDRSTNPHNRHDFSIPRRAAQNNDEPLERSIARCSSNPWPRSVVMVSPAVPSMVLHVACFRNHLRNKKHCHLEQRTRHQYPLQQHVLSKCVRTSTFESDRPVPYLTRFHWPRCMLNTSSCSFYVALDARG